MIPFVQVDAFTSEAFAGNPAAVCFLPGEREASWMQKVAREMNLAETAFLRPLDGEGGRREFLATRSATALPSGLSPRRLCRRGRIRAAVVHADSGNRPVWSRDAGKRARVVGKRAARANRDRAVPYAERIADRGSHWQRQRRRRRRTAAAAAAAGWMQLDFPLTPNEPRRCPTV